MLLRNVDFTDCFSQIFYGCVVLIWSVIVTEKGTAIEPKVTVTLDGQTLVEGKDFKVTYKKNKNVVSKYVVLNCLKTLLMDHQKCKEQRKTWQKMRMHSRCLM